MGSNSNNELERQIEQTEERIEFYRHMLNNSYCPVQKNYYYRAMETEEAALDSLRGWASRENSDEDISVAGKKVFTMEELSKNNGKAGKPFYVAVNGVVYDVSNKSTWKKGTHFGLVAGTDVTRAFAACHMSPAVLTGLPIVGTLKR